MSRAINLTLNEADVTARCLAAGVSISAIEPLMISGTHLVCLTSEGAETIRRLLKKFLIPGKVKRFPFYVPASRYVR
ncbi:MAG: hypothetical protein V4579_09085 [Pseudomonadota bacterium]